MHVCVYVYHHHHSSVLFVSERVTIFSRQFFVYKREKSQTKHYWCPFYEILTYTYTIQIYTKNGITQEVNKKKENKKKRRLSSSHIVRIVCFKKKKFLCYSFIFIIYVLLNIYNKNFIQLLIQNVVLHHVFF